MGQARKAAERRPPFRAAKKRASSADPARGPVPKRPRLRKPPTSGYRQLRGHTKAATRIVPLEGGSRVATACLDGSVRIFSTRTGRIEHRMRHGEEVEALAAIGQHYLVFGGGNEGHDSAKKENLRREGKEVGRRDGNAVGIWDVRDGRKVAEFWVPGVVWAVARLPGGSGGRFVVIVENDLRFYEFTKDGLVEPLFSIGCAHDEFVQDTAVCGTRLVTAGSDGLAKVWCALKFALIRPLAKMHDGFLHCVDMNEKHIVTGGVDQCLALYSSVTYEVVRVIDMSLSYSPVTYAALIGDDHIASASSDGSVDVSHVSGSIVSRLSVPLHVFDAIILSDGRMAACGGEKKGDGNAVLFKAETKTFPIFSEHAGMRSRTEVGTPCLMGAHDDDDVCELPPPPPPKLETVVLDEDEEGEGSCHAHCSAPSTKREMLPEFDLSLSLGDAVEYWTRTRVEAACDARGINRKDGDLRIMRLLLRGWNFESATATVSRQTAKGWSIDELHVQCHARGLYFPRKCTSRDELIDGLVSYVPRESLHRFHEKDATTAKKDPTHDSREDSDDDESIEDDGDGVESSSLESQGVPSRGLSAKLRQGVAKLRQGLVEGVPGTAPLEPPVDTAREDAVIVIADDEDDCNVGNAGTGTVMEADDEVVVSVTEGSVFDLDALKAVGLNATSAQKMSRRDLATALAAFYVSYCMSRIDEFKHVQECLQASLRRLAKNGLHVVGKDALSPADAAEELLCWADVYGCGGCGPGPELEFYPIYQALKRCNDRK